LHVLTLLRKFETGRVTDTTLRRVASLVCASSERFGYDPLLLIAVIHVESIFDPAAKGRYQSGNESGAIGLMQLQFETASEVAKQLNLPKFSRGDLLKPDVNLMLGVAYLTQLIAQFRSFKLGLLAYNQGPGAVEQTLSNNEPLTVDYYKLVLTSYYDLRKMAAQIDREVEGK
jgi:soluble lytic murein transglycosylase-like protein